MTRQRQVEQSPVVAGRAPLLTMAMPLIAHVQIRNRGTIGGSLAHADPAAELPAVVSALAGTLVVKGPDGERRIGVEDFYTGLFATDLAPDEMLTAIELPPKVQRGGFSIQEMSRRHGDYALAGVAVQVEMAQDMRCESARVAYFSVGEGPVMAESAAAMLVGEQVTPELLEAVAQQAASIDLDPPSDIHATTRYRRHLAKVLGQRALLEAFQRAGVVAG
jgi:carbon-monoxide dehydrogenase medium subunit